MRNISEGGNVQSFDNISPSGSIFQDVFRLQGARAERYLYLFEKELLIGKKREDGLINVKTHISVGQVWC